MDIYSGKSGSSYEINSKEVKRTNSKGMVSRLNAWVILSEDSAVSAYRHLRDGKIGYKQFFERGDNPPNKGYLFWLGLKGDKKVLKFDLVERVSGDDAIALSSLADPEEGEEELEMASRELNKK